MHYNRKTGLFEDEVQPRKGKSTFNRLLDADDAVEALFIVIEKV